MTEAQLITPPISITGKRGRVARDKGARRRRWAGGGGAMGLRKREEGEVTGELTKSEERRREEEWKRVGQVNPGGILARAQHRRSADSFVIGRRCC